MRFIVPSLVTAAALATAFGAHAEGLYVGGSIGPTHYSDSGIDGAGMTDRSSTGGKVFGGYSFTPNLGLELGYADLGHFDSQAGGVHADGYYLDAVGTLPLANSFSLLGRVGVFNGRLEGDPLGNDRGTSYKVGVGVQYDLNANVGLRAEWERYNMDALNTKPNTDMFTVGVTYHF